MSIHGTLGKWLPQYRQWRGITIKRLGLRDLFYRQHLYPRSVTAREPAGYFFMNQPPVLPQLLGRDVSRNSLSFARGAGGIISTTAT